MSNSDENQIESAVKAGQRSVEASDRFVYMGRGNIPVAFLPGDGGGMEAEILEGVLALEEQRAPAPRRLKGSANLTELDSFIQHANRFKDPNSVIYADTNRGTLTAILNYHEAAKQPTPPPDGSTASASTYEPGSPRWADHRGVYTCPLSEQWKTWRAKDGMWMKQEEFGEFIEANLKDIANPTPEDAGMPAPANLLQVARNLRVFSKVDFERKINPTTGEGVFVHKKENDIQGSTTVPAGFLLGIPVFEAGALYRVGARLRFNVEAPEGGKAAAKFRFELVTPAEILKHAFAEVREKASEATGLPVFAGSPES